MCRVPKLTSFSTSVFICAPLTGGDDRDASFGVGGGRRRGGDQQQAGKQSKFTHTTSPLSAHATGICGAAGLGEPQPQDS